MNIPITLDDNRLSPHHVELAACFSFLMRHVGHEQRCSVLEDALHAAGDEDRRKTLRRVVRALRSTGLQTVFHTPGTDTWQDIAGRLPVLVEHKSGRLAIVTHLNAYGGDVPGSVTLKTVDQRGELVDNNVAPSDFLEEWKGGLLWLEVVNTALICFSLVAREHKIELTQERLRHEYNLGNREIGQKTLIRMGKDAGMKTRLVNTEWEQIFLLNKAFPAIARLKNDRHMVVVGAVGATPSANDAAIAVFDPLEGPNGSHRRLSRPEFERIWSGDIYLFKPTYKLTDENQPFSLRWFVPEILRQKVAFIDVALAVLFINAIALVTPVFFQIVIDKVLVNQAFTTLHVLGIGMTVMLIVNASLDFLRDYILLHATNKIDLRVTARTFQHMLNLPLDFFERATAGVLTKHMQQTANIRGFLTGNVFLTMLEATSLFVFLPFLFFYSFKLIGLVLVFTLLIALVILLLISPFKRRLNALYDAEGNRQAMLVETINGMPTVKAMAIEPLLRNRWEEKVARAISMQFRVGKISITAKALTQFLERLMTIMLIWVGAGQVFDGTITIGALIAFQMLAGRVTSPLVRLVGLIHQYQEAALSVEKLGAVMNARPEWGVDRHGARTSLRGDIVLDSVRFRYGPDLPDVLKEISLTIPAGSTLGIVGPSGSGKTTLTRMLQKVCFPSSGTIRINNCYLNELDTAHLRRNLGVVLQESFLFRATVADNIRAGQAGATRQQIIEAAILAGADEFIVHLPQGYDTMLEEGASNLSGGQRQRLAIARALLTSPEILILDEATSSLDPESERIIRDNLERISRGRTVLMVSHRLSMICRADAILVLQKGQVVGYGKHDDLLASCGLYQSLWKQQMEIR